MNFRVLFFISLIMAASISCVPSGMQEIFNPSIRIEKLAQESQAELNGMANDWIAQNALSPYAENGNSNIYGRVFLNERDHFPAGKRAAAIREWEVILAPQSSYMRVFYLKKARLYDEIRSIKATELYDDPSFNSMFSELWSMAENFRWDLRLDPFIRVVKADEHGQFSFYNVPPGKYVIYCPFYWRIADLPIGTVVYANLDVVKDVRQYLDVMVATPIQ